MISLEGSRRITNSHKLGIRLLIMISIPVLVQLLLTAGIWTLRSAAEARAHDCGIAREAGAAVRVITGKALTLNRFAHLSMQRGLTIDFDSQKELTQLRIWCEWLRTTPGTGKLGATAAEVLALSEKMTTIIRQASISNRIALSQHQTLKYKTEDLEPKIKSLRDQLENDLLQLEVQQQWFAEQSSTKGSNVQDWLFIGAVGGIVLNLATLTAFGLFFSRDIIARLAQVQENVRRIQRRGKLLPRLKGRDEISQLDESFHEMSGVLTLVEEKERTLFERAYNVLCSVDKSRRFVEINQASTKVLGFRPDELLGRTVESIVINEEKQRLIQSFQQTMQKNAQASFESTMTRKDGSILETLWTTSSTAGSEKIFCVVHDISERKAAQRLRKEMVQMVTHDLRSPLTSLGVVYAMLQDNKLGQLNAQGHKLLTAAQNNSGRMLRLINDLLDIEKLEAGMVQLIKAPTNLSALFDQSLDSVSSLANQKQIMLFNNAAGTSFIATVDPHRIVQVLVNLLSNAIKFSPPGGSVSVALFPSEQHVEINVVDQGRGIPAAYVG